MPVKSPRFALFDLAEGKSYSFRVRCCNSAGVGEASVSTGEITVGDKLGEAYVYIMYKCYSSKPILHRAGESDKSISQYQPYSFISLETAGPSCIIFSLIPVHYGASLLAVVRLTFFLIFLTNIFLNRPALSPGQCRGHQEH